MDNIANVDLREALTAIAKNNTFYHLDSDIKISFDQMELAAKMGDYSDKTFIWVSYPSGIDCYNEREVFQHDTRAYNGVQYHGAGTEREPKLAYAVDVGELKDGSIFGNIYEIDLQEYAKHVRAYEVKSTSMQLFFDDIRRKDKYEIMPLAEFNKRFPLNLPKMVHWRNLTNDTESLNNAIGKAWDMRLSGSSQVSIWQHTDKLEDKQLAFYANQLVQELNKLKEPNSTDKQNFNVSLDVRASHNFRPEQLGSLLDNLPFDTAAFAVQKGQRDMKLVVPKDEILQLRQEKVQGQKQNKADKVQKPSLIAALDDGEKKSKAEFGSKQSERNTPKKSTNKSGEEL